MGVLPPLSELLEGVRWNGLDVYSPPRFETVTEHRVAKALCTFVLGETTCTVNQGAGANAALTFFQAVAPTTVTCSPSGTSDHPECEFQWGGDEYTMLCGGGSCVLQQMQPPPEEGLLESSVGGLATLLTLGFVGCAASDSPGARVRKDVAHFRDVTAEETSTYVAPHSTYIQLCSSWIDSDLAGYFLCLDWYCQFRPALAATYSSCVFIEAIADASDPSCSDADKALPADHETLLALLTAQPFQPFHLLLTGDNKWPHWAFNSCLPVESNGNVGGTIGSFTVDPIHGAIQLWLVKPEGVLCVSVYESPCTDALGQCRSTPDASFQAAFDGGFKAAVTAK